MRKITSIPIILSSLLFAGCSLQPTVPSSLPSVTPTVQVTTAPTSVPSLTPTVDESSLLKTVIKQALVAKHGDSANELTISVSKIVGDYASGGASASGGGGMWFAAKVNGEWKLVWDGNGVILCQDLVTYPNFPASLISECYDQKTNKSIKR